MKISKGMKIIDVRAMPHTKTAEELAQLIKDAATRKVGVINSVSRGSAFVKFAHDQQSNTFTQIALTDLKPVPFLNDVFIDDYYGTYTKALSEVQ